MSARRRTAAMIFDELFYLQLGLGLRKRSRTQSRGQPVHLTDGKLVQRMRELLPFKLTGAQRRVLAKSTPTWRGEQPMQRLVQGDVGSGKTMVAWLASLRTIEQGYQALWMAPTEILAEQHFRSLSSIRRRLGSYGGAAHGGDTGKRAQGIAAAHRARRSAVSSSAPTR